jgi:hypothetical protein
MNRDKTTGKFMVQKKAVAKKDVRREQRTR